MRTSCTVGERFLIRGIRVSVLSDEGEILKQAKERMKRAGISASALHFRLYKKSVDARDRENVQYVCTVLAESAEGEISIPSRSMKALDMVPLEEETPDFSHGTEPLTAPPCVVGMGPAGMFAALALAREGYAPILLDRGGSVAERGQAVAAFRECGLLDPECNVQFGAGGAGTFSDGKLVTRISDPACGFVLRTLVQFGAPEEILTAAKPHIGTDLLRLVVDNILSEVERLGGRVIYHCRLEDLEELPGGILRLVTSQGELHCGCLILAPGHSARDTYRRLIEKNYAIEPKPISVGVRIEHLQSRINEALYGRFAGTPGLGHAEYTLSDTKGERGVYTFCMCPGGEVMAAASEEGHLVVNGMSYHARSGPNANAAVAVSVSCRDLEPVEGNLALGAIAFQRRIERAAYVSGGSDYTAPVMTVGDFLAERKGSLPTTVQPSYRDGRVTPADFSEIFPSFVTGALRRGIISFGRKLRGYDAPDAILTAPETRTSAPLRILRHPDTRTAIGHDRIYPAGEGAGYAGGITSAAVDGLRAAMALIGRFAPPKRGEN